jgi:hypothetical protein
MTEIKKRKSRRPTPEKWLSGPDPHRHEMFTAWHKHRAQARFRKEPYELSFEDFITVWGSYTEFKCRGKTPESLCMTRRIDSGAWSVANCEIITRYEQLCRSAKLKIGKPRKRRLLKDQT